MSRILLVRCHNAIDAFDGKSIPHGENSFDVVMFVDVLHHASQPMTLLREAVRVARQAIVIQDNARVLG